MPHRAASSLRGGFARAVAESHALAIGHRTAWIGTSLGMLTATVFAVFAALACLPVAGCDTVAGRMANAAEAARQGDNFLAKGNRHKAVEAYTRAIKLKPDLTSAYLSRAVALNELGQPEEALADFTKAIELDPTNSYPYEQRSHIYRTALKDSRRADADKARAEALRQGRWNNLQKLRKK